MEPSLGCVFCGFTGASRSSLVVHLAEEHGPEVLARMGLRHLFLKSQSRAGEPGSFPATLLHCPLCGKVESGRRLAEHFMRRHPDTFLDSYARFQDEEQEQTTCVLCGAGSLSRPELLRHLVTHHFGKQLLAECGAAMDHRLACNPCPFAAETEEEVTLPYGIEHGRLDFFYSLEVVRRQELGELHVTGGPALGGVAGDYPGLASLLP